MNGLRLIQLQQQPSGHRRLARVSGDMLELLAAYQSAYQLATVAAAGHQPLPALVQNARVSQTVSYDDVYQARSEWAILPSFDHPSEPARCRVTGTGLTHLRSAEARSGMHAERLEETDSSRMYQLGVQGGRPASGDIGAAPEWFYKGDGSILRAHGVPLPIPPYASDGGEEAEVAGIYLIDAAGEPRRVGLTVGNEWSDHALERRNYLYLAHSKLRPCAIGPELVVGAAFHDTAGTVSIRRDSDVLWQKSIRSGEHNMAHSLANLEHHHFKYEAHRRPGDVHIHFFGADALSCSAGVALADGDVVEIAFEGFGRPLRTVVVHTREPETLVRARPL